jgi:FkbH-like protein
MSDKPKRGRIKCVVWDLDNTVWDGVLLEDLTVQRREQVVATIRELDQRGILHSIASRNEAHLALAKLEELGLQDYFLHPQISWNSKAAAVATVAKKLNIGLDAIAFVDDQEFERAEVNHEHPTVLCLDATEVGEILDRIEFQPRFITDEARQRRELYRAGIDRDQAEEQFDGVSAQFLAGLGLEFTIRRAATTDLQRAEELTVRTNQLNSTGVTYSYEELAAFANSPDHLLLVASLTDRFGSYGTIGLALVDKGQPIWSLKLLLMSCRVMSRGVGNLLLTHIMRLARDAGARLQAEFTPTDRNRIMFVTYRFAGFRQAGQREGVQLLEASLDDVPEPPDHVVVHIDPVLEGTPA